MSNFSQKFKDFDWQSVVRTVAPTIGTALGGPMAGTAVKFIADKLLLDADATTADIEQAILSANPEQLEKLKQLDQEFKLQMKKLDIDVYKLDQLDRNSARDLAKIDMKPQIALSIFFVSGYFWVLYVLMGGNFDITDGLQNTLLVIIGVITTSMAQIMNFWFGSSSGSKDKTKNLIK